jgi:MFS family permease
VLLTALVVGGIALILVPTVRTIPPLALSVLTFTASNALVSAMVFSMLATEVPLERRSQTLNLVYLPLYAAGIIGPIIGGTLAGAFGTSAPFFAGAAVFLVGAVVVALRVHPARVGEAAAA